MVDPPTLTVRYRTVSIVTSTGSFGPNAGIRASKLVVVQCPILLLRDAPQFPQLLRPLALEGVPRYRRLALRGLWSC
jgi:hypothetical protein